MSASGRRRGAERGAASDVRTIVVGLTAVQSTRPDKPATQREGTCERDRNNQLSVVVTIYGHQLERRKEKMLSLRRSH